MKDEAPIQTAEERMEEDRSQGQEDRGDDLIEDDPAECPRDIADDHVDANIQEIVRQHWDNICTRSNMGRPIQDFYNIRLIGKVSRTQIDKHMRAIFTNLTCRCKMNISYGLVLRHNETGELRYFHPSQNNAQFFRMPLVIATEKDMEAFIGKIHDGDPAGFGIEQRPDTKWTVALVTNMALYVNKMPNFPIGCTRSKELPP